MHNLVDKILCAFKNHPESEFSTTELVKLIFPHEFQEIENDFDSYGLPKSRGIKRIKAKLHRKLLYHLNNLVESDILKMTGQKDKGEKIFSLTLEKGEEMLLKDIKKTIVLSMPVQPNLPLEGYEEKKVIMKIEEPTWISSLNSILLDGTFFHDCRTLKKYILKIFPCVNDVIGINDFQEILSRCSELEVSLIASEINQISNDFNKSVSFSISLNNPDKRIFNFLSEILRLNNQKINVIIPIDIKTLHENDAFLKSVIQLCIRYKGRIYFKNNLIHSSPYIMGLAGPYTFNEEEWRIAQQFSSKRFGIACGQASLAIDMKKLLSIESNKTKVRELFQKAANTLLLVNSHQRGFMRDYFKPVLDLLGDNPWEFFMLSKNYVRLWNYGVKQEEHEDSLIIDIISSIKETTDSFCSHEETIYKCCGLPTRFRIAFSYLSREIGEEKLSTSAFDRIAIYGIKDIYDKNFLKYIQSREKISRIFDGGDRVRFFRMGEIDDDTVVKELSIILSMFKVPLFCYDFSQLTARFMKLTEYFENGNNR
jgi:hypothetical protein